MPTRWRDRPALRRPAPANHAVAGLLAHPCANACTIEKRGVRKFIDQAPWYSAGVFQGSVELSLGIPEMMPHFVRQSP